VAAAGDAVAPARTSAGVFGMARTTRTSAPSALERGGVDAGRHRDDQRAGAQRAGDLTRDLLEDLRLDREHDHIGGGRDRGVAGRHVHAVLRRQLVAAIGARRRRPQPLAGDHAAVQDAADERLGHVASADEADGSGEAHGGRSSTDLRPVGGG
jgi:hypothetical protein